MKGLNDETLKTYVAMQFTKLKYVEDPPSAEKIATACLTINCMMQNLSLDKREVTAKATAAIPANNQAPRLRGGCYTCGSTSHRQESAQE